MRMAKQRRKYERRLDVARQVWREDRATIKAAVDQVYKVREKHASFDRVDPYGRRGARRLFCVMCVTNPYPCPTWVSLNTLLEQLERRLVA